MLRLDTTPSLYAPDVAERKARALSSDTDDDWTYRAEHYESGWSAVLIFDEDGALVGKLNDGGAA